MGKKLELLGSVFNRLTVIAEGRHVKRTSRRGTRVLWRCRCSCGRECEIEGFNLKSGHSQSCGCLAHDRKVARLGVSNPTWKGGRNLHPSGYVILKGSPWGLKPGESIREHRYMMERKLGRPLLPDETVHHVNGKRDDNRIENLELWSNNHSNGQRVSDLIFWAEEILSLYRPEVLVDRGCRAHKIPLQSLAE